MPKQKVQAVKTRSEQVEFIVEDMQDWCKRDPSSFWEHVQDLEREYLKNKPDKEVEEIYNESV